jgi:hypothetical protein
MKRRRYVIAVFFLAAFLSANFALADVSQITVTSDTLHGQVSQCAASIGGAHFPNQSQTHQIVVGSLTYLRTSQEVFGLLLKVGAYSADKKPIPIEFAELMVHGADGSTINTKNFKKADFGDDPNFAEYISTNLSKDVGLLADLAEGGTLKYTIKGDYQDETLILSPPEEPKFMNEMTRCIADITQGAKSNLQDTENASRRRQ